MNDIKTISIDIETYSDVDLSKCGVYKYSESENFEILLFAYSINQGDVKVVDLALGEQIPTEIITALVDNKTFKWAYNANFERVCLSRYLSRYYPNIFTSYSIDEDTVNVSSSNVESNIISYNILFQILMANFSVWIFYCI